MPLGEQEFTYHLDKQFFEKMECDAVRDADLDLRLSVDRRADLYEMKFHIDGTVTVACDRCLDDLKVPVSTIYEIAVRYGEEYNDEADDLLIIPESDSYFDVAPIAYDTVMLALPITCVHADGECNAAMSEILGHHLAIDVAGIDAEDVDESETAVDPRWDALKKLRDNNK